MKVSSFLSLGFFCCFLVCFVFFMFEKKKTTIMCCCLLLWWCSNEEGNGNLLPSPFSLVVLRFHLVVLGVYRVQGIIKEEFVANVVQVEMQCYHLYIVSHVTSGTNAAAFYETKHKIVNNDMIQGFHFIQSAKFFIPFIFLITQYLNFGPLIYYREPFFSLCSLTFFDLPILYIFY